MTFSSYGDSDVITMSYDENGYVTTHILKPGISKLAFIIMIKLFHSRFENIIDTSNHTKF